MTKAAKEYVELKKQRPTIDFHSRCLRTWLYMWSSQPTACLRCGGPL